MIINQISGGSGEGEVVDLSTVDVKFWGTQSTGSSGNQAIIYYNSIDGKISMYAGGKQYLVQNFTQSCHNDSISTYKLYSTSEQVKNAITTYIAPYLEDGQYKCLFTSMGSRYTSASLLNACVKPIQFSITNGAVTTEDTASFIYWKSSNPFITHLCLLAEIE